MALEAYEDVMPIVAASAWVHEAATVIGRCTLGDEVSVWPGAVLRGDVNTIEIGARSNIQDGAVVHVTHESEVTRGAATVVGKDVTVGHRAVLHGCTIGDRCLVGMGAIVLDGAVVEPEVMIGAGVLVPPGKRLESGWLYVGTPAKPVRRLTDEERAFFSYSARHYVELMRRYRDKN